MTAIEWTDQTWNPTTGCSKVSPGCAHCYAETLSLRFGWSKKPWTPENAAENVVLHPERLNKPLTWRKPSMVFVNSMSDLFHEEIDYHFIREVFNVMRRCNGDVVAATGKPNPSHTFQVLTKRPEIALELFEARKLGFTTWPAHIWLGTSIENDRHVARADVLREIPAPIRFISAEPLLGPLPSLDLTDIQWVIAGGESGNGAREMKPEWVRDLRDACIAECHCCDGMWRQRDLPPCAMRVRPAFFFKQWGGRTPKAGGSSLDGREWSEYPEIVTPAHA